MDILTVLSALRSPSLVLGKDGQIKFCSPAASTLLRLQKLPADFVQALKLDAAQEEQSRDWLRILLSDRGSFADVAKLGPQTLAQQPELNIHYLPLYENQTLVGVLVQFARAENSSSSDGSDEARDHEARMILSRFQNAAGFRRALEFFEETIKILPGLDRTAALNELHGIKGYLATFYIFPLHAVVRNVELELRSAAGALQAHQMETLQEASRAFYQQYNDMLQLSSHFHDLQFRHLSLESLAKFEAKLRAEGSPLLSEFSESFINLPADEILVFLKDFALKVGAREQKPLQVVLKHSGQRVPPLWFQKTQPDLERELSNRILHSIETVIERQSLGKPREATLRLTLVSAGDSLKVEIWDDGHRSQTSAILFQKAS